MSVIKESKSISMDEILKVSHIKKHFDEGLSKIDVLQDVNFSIKRGEWIAIMGPSGSGKTTLLTLIALIDKQTSGDILLEGIDIQNLSSKGKSEIRSKKIGIVFQNHYLVPTMSVKENVELPFIWSKEKLSFNEIEARVKSVIDFVGLSQRIEHFPDEISGGEKQRVAIARALVNKPPLLLLDEPTGNLDVKTGKAILALFKKISRNNQVSIIMVTHDPEAAKQADKILLLKHGMITEL